MLSAQEEKDLKLKANIVRQYIIQMLEHAGSGHSGGSLGMVDILTALYFKIIKHDPENPHWQGRDRVVLSNGHICPALYAVLAKAGYFPVETLLTLRELGSPLQGHPHRENLPGIETTSGPLGCGLSQAAGMALVGRISQKSWKIICLMSDGEQDEGNTWEGAMLAAKNKLRNLIAVIDRNKIQIDGNTEVVMPLDSMKDKYKAFGWQAIEIDGHNFQEITSAFSEAQQAVSKPTVIIAKTVLGKGVSFMEGRALWHGKAPNKEEAEKAIEELKKQN